MITLISLSLVSFLTLLTYTYQQSVTYDFTISQRQPQFESHFHLALLVNEPFCIGTPYQCIKVQFDPGYSLPIILNKDSFQEYNSFSKGLSSTYQRLDSSHDQYSAQKLISGISSYDKIKFGPLELNMWNFYLGKDVINELHYSSIGLAIENINERTYHYFINKLKDNHLISMRQYSIEYGQDSNGKIAFGDMTINSNNYTKLFTIEKHTKYFVNRFYSVNDVFIDNTNQIVLTQNIEVSFDESFGLIQMPSKMIKKVEETIISRLKCDKKTYTPKNRYEITKAFVYFLCHKDGWSEVNNISFVFENDTMTLSKEDMLIPFEGDLMLFSIVFKEDYREPFWIIGEPVLKHYLLVNNFEKDIVTVYRRNIIQNGVEYLGLMGWYLYNLTSFVSLVGVVFVIVAFVHKMKFH